MEQIDHRNPAPAFTDARLPALSPDAERQAVLDAHGFDLDDFDWIPVKRKPRVDGWSAEKQRLFIATLADTGSVTLAAKSVGMSVKSAYALRRAPDAEGFDRAWRSAIRQAMSRLIDVCMERALEGTEEPVHDRDGQVVGHRIRHHDRMAMFLLRAHMPDLFRPETAKGAAGSDRVPPPEPVAVALERLDPVTPAAPHALLHPDDLEASLQIAALGDGTLPRWHRDRDLVEREGRPSADPLLADAPLGDAFERQLAAAKAGTWQPPATPQAVRPKGKRARRRVRA